MRLPVRKGLLATIYSSCLAVPAPIHILLSSGESYSERIPKLSGVCSTLLSFRQCQQQTVIYCRLFKYTQQHTFTENSDWTPHILRPAVSIFHKLMMAIVH